MRASERWAWLNGYVNDHDYWAAVTSENFFRLYIGSRVILILESIAFAYAYFILGEILILPLFIIPLCLFNVCMWWLSKKRDLGEIRRVLVYGNVLLVLALGSTWNMVMGGTHQAIPIYMFIVFFVAAAFIMRPQCSFFRK